VIAAPRFTRARSAGAFYVDAVRKPIVTRFLLSVVMWLMVLIMVIPLLWALLTSFKPDQETLRYPPTLLPQTWTLNGYRELFKALPFAQYYWNSLVAAGVTAIGTILLTSTAAYSLTRFRTRAGDAAGLIGLVAYMLPGILIVVPVFTVLHDIHQVDSLPAVIVLYIAYFTPFGLWQLRSYFAGIPIDLEESAMVDGATRFEAFYLIILPQALPGIIATGIFTFSVAWNEYLFASLLLFSPQNQTLSAGLATVLVGTFDIYSWSILMAGAVLMTLPILVIFMFVQRYLVSGLGGGAVKG
jgi:ABC-type glycerol-3-phosphate transport system permease component